MGRRWLCDAGNVGYFDSGSLSGGCDCVLSTYRESQLGLVLILQTVPLLLRAFFGFFNWILCSCHLYDSGDYISRCRPCSTSLDPLIMGFISNMYLLVFQCVVWMNMNSVTQLLCVTFSFLGFVLMIKKLMESSEFEHHSSFIWCKPYTTSDFGFHSKIFNSFQVDSCFMGLVEFLTLIYTFLN